MSPSAFVRLLSLVFAAWSLFGTAASAAEPRTNVILIMADDLGYACIGANGCSSYQTPRLDRLAAEGARFEHCYIQPLCTPTRVQLMTGQYNVRNYVRFGLLDPEQTTFAHLFRRAGYATCIVGKWQLSGGFEGPNHFGFDEYCLWQLTRRPGRYKNAGLEVNGKEVDHKHGEYGPDLVNDYALDFISRSKDKPFFLYYPMMLTHDPYDATPDSADYATAPYEGQRKDEAGAKGGTGKEARLRHFGEMVEYMDKLIGKVVDRVAAEGLSERTLIIFTGDNGTGRGTPTKMGDRTVIGGKGTPDESGMRVPLVVGGAGVKQGVVLRDLVDATDFLPTICDAAGVTTPSDLTIDGRSFLPQCRGEAGKPREWIYCWYSPSGGKRAEAEFAKNHDYKLYRDGKLFDVRDGDFDKHPVERKKLDDAGRESVAKLQAALDRYQDARPARLSERLPKKKATE
jgi:arylsulfatase A